MKKFYQLFAICLACTTISFSQAPQTFNYQAIARDAGGTLISNADLDVRIGILQEGNLVWQEDHAVQTNNLGLFSLNIGDASATNQSGSAGAFDQIPWAEGDLHLQVSVDDGNGFVLLGTSEFQAVPYALFALDGPGGSGSPGDAVWSKQGDTLTTMNYVGIGTSNPNKSTLAIQGLSIHPETPLFEVRREDGFPVFAVYNDGVMVYVDEDTKATRRGFAVGGYSRGGTKGPTQEYLSVTPDSVRVYVPEPDGSKGVKGGFAVGGYSRTKAGTGRDLLFVNHDSTRVYVPNEGNDVNTSPDEQLQGGFAVQGYTPDAKGPDQYLMGVNKGVTRFASGNPDQGFSIGGIEPGDTQYKNYLELTPTNSFIGNNAGINTRPIDPEDPNELSSMNVFVGYRSGEKNEYGHHNTYLGFCAGTFTVGDKEDPEASAHNTFIGTQSGFKNTIGSYNVFLGCYTGFENLDGWQNVFIGGNAGYTGVHTSSSTMVGNNSGAFYDGYGNVTFLGFYSGNSASGENNTFLGSWAGSYAGAGEENVYVGTRSGQYAEGYYNVVMGNDAGRGVASSTDYMDNVLIGYEAGTMLESGSENTFLGSMAGRNATGSGNVFIGYYTGANEAGDNNLYIDNSDTDYPLIYGSFDDTDPWVGINGELWVAQDVYSYGYYYDSDDLSKSGARALENPLNKVLSMSAVRYEVQPEAKSGSPEAQPVTKIGLVTDEVENVLPELVSERKKGKAINYSGMIPVLLEAMKEQQAQIEALKEEIALLKQQESLADQNSEVK